MERYFSLGYYNCLDAVMLNGCSADKVVSNMENGIGSFYVYDEGSQVDESADWLLKNHSAKMTEDGEYIVVYDVADRFETMPLDLVEQHAQDEFVEVWKKMG